MSTAADDLQDELDEGPCVDFGAGRATGWQRSADTSTDTRWPRWGPAASALGARSLLSVQLLRQDRPFGAITLYAEETRQFEDREVVDRGLIWCGHAASALAAARATADLRTAIDSQHAIGVAQGLLMERHGLSETDTFRLFTRLASQRQEKVTDIARYVLDHRKLPTE